MEISLMFSIISVTIAVLSFAFNRKDKGEKDSSDDAYHLGQIDTKLKNIEEFMAKIEKKIDTYDKEMDEKIETAIKHHVLEYHKNISGSKRK